jgi:LysM repeat protein
MKILKIFSMVLALHLVLLVVFLVSPGCQSQPSPSADSSAPSATENWSNQSASGTYTQTGASSLDPLPVSGADAFANQPLLGQTPADRARSAPTRPSSVATPSSSPSVKDREGVLEPVGQAPVEVPIPEPTYIVYTVRRGDSLWSISRQFGVTIQNIVDANPGIDPDSIQYGQKVMVPDHFSNGTSGRSGTGAPPKPELPPGASTYTVKAGDFLARIANQHGTTVGAIRKANRLTSDLIQVGQVLVIPGGTDRQADTSSGLSISADAVTVTVQPGDTIGEIARNYDVTVKELMEANAITDPRRIRVGQRLVIPGFTSVDSSRTEVTVKPAPSTAGPPPVTEAPPPDGTTIESVPTTSSDDLDQLLPGDDLPTPVIPIDEPVPAP